MKARHQKRAQARARQRAYDRLTFEEKLARLDAAGHKALKQRLRLHEAAAGVRWT